MGQAATLCRISSEKFIELQKMDNKVHFNPFPNSKPSPTFEGSFMALEFILSKGRQSFEVELIAEIFNPKSMFGGYSGLLNCETDDEIEAFLMSDDNYCIPYIDKNKIDQINQVLNGINEIDIYNNYDSQELNENGIYPRVWHDDNSENLAFNRRQILTDFAELKTVFQEAHREKDYILVYID
jgi:hypothetical protein